MVCVSPVNIDHAESHIRGVKALTVMVLLIMWKLFIVNDFMRFLFPNLFQIKYSLIRSVIET